MLESPYRNICILLVIGASWLASVCRGEIGQIGLGGLEAGLWVLTEEGRYWPRCGLLIERGGGVWPAGQRDCRDVVSEQIK